MKKLARPLVLFALLSAILGVVVFLPRPVPRVTSANALQDSSSIGPVSAPTEVLEEDAATLRESSPAESQTVAGVLTAAGSDSLPEPCVEAANAGFQFAEGVELNDDACRAVAGLIAGPMVPALPGFPGFEVRDTGDPFRERLIDEPDDPEWSRSMESRIYNEIGALVDFPVIALQVTCKTSTCGFLIAYSSSVHSGGNYNEVGQHLADTLGFNGYYGGHAVRPEVSTGFTYIYLGDWITERPGSNAPPRTFPATFEEISDSLTDHPDEPSP